MTKTRRLVNTPPIPAAILLFHSYTYCLFVGSVTNIRVFVCKMGFLSRNEIGNTTFVAIFILKSLQNKLHVTGDTQYVVIVKVMIKACYLKSRN